MFFGLILGLFLIFVIFYKIKFRNYPPGPFGFPIVGYLPFLFKKNPIKILNDLKEKYGKVYSIGLGKYNCVVVSDYKLIIEAYKESAFAGRPDFEVNMVRNHGKKRAIIFSDGKLWNEQRTFAVRNLRAFGLGKKSMEGLLLQECQGLNDYLGENLESPIELRNKFNASVLNSLWFICTGNRFEDSDPNFRFVIDKFITQLQKTETAGIVFFFPWILKQNILVKGFWETFKTVRNKLQSIIQDEIEDHEKSYDPNETRDFIDAYLSQINKTQDSTSSFYGEEGRINLRLVLVDLFLAGAETTSSTLQWALLYLITWPEVQRKVQKEIDNVIGGNKNPSLEDKNEMIYTEATLLEVHRYCAMVPFSLYHQTTIDTEIAGFKIPKKTVILANLREVHHDKGYWKDPENFRPERFISSDGKIIKHEAWMPFSTGKRTCIGESLANQSLFLFFTSMLQKYTFEKDPNSPPPSLRYSAPSIIVSPKSYNVIIKNREI